MTIKTEDYPTVTSSSVSRTIADMLSRLDTIDASLGRLRDLITGYWIAFWLLNGFDKFFNEPTFFGVTRDAKFAEYFSRIGLSEPVALIALYGIGLYEIALGALMSAALMLRGHYRALVLPCLELGAALFVLFSVGDVLFGDRKELWEHGCYLGLTLLSYQVVRADVLRTRR